MALIVCPECGKEISEHAQQCPNCGCPSSAWKTANDASSAKAPGINKTIVISVSVVVALAVIGVAFFMLGSKSGNKAQAEVTATDSTQVAEVKTIDNEAILNEIQRDVTDFLKKLYAGYNNDNLLPDSETGKHYSQKLAAYINKAQQYEEEEGYIVFDFDWWIWAQDWDEIRFESFDSVDVVSANEANAYYTIQGTPMQLRLIKENDHWLIDDILGKDEWTKGQYQSPFYDPEIMSEFK